MSPTQRTQRRLKALGYHVANCERKMPCTPAGYRGRLITQDLWGIIDTWGINEHDDLLVQSTSGAHHADHVTKIKNSPHIRSLLRRHVVEVWSWKKRGARDKPKRWEVRRTRFYLKGKILKTIEL